MNSLYPFKFKAIYKDKIWGGTKIKSHLGLDYAPLSNCGEAWLLSGVTDENSEVVNGHLSENELNELVEIYMGDLVGEKVYQKFGNQFPILVKVIDANDWLSIQVHPDDELAKKRGLENGKTEMWYILAADKGAELISGFKTKISKEEYIQKLEDKTLKEVLNFEKVDEGDVFFMPAGRVHALGPGMLLAEIQQTSDTTYRIYDWDRVDEKGMSRELHIEEAVDAIDFSVEKEYKTKYEKKKNKTVNIVESPYFMTNLIEMDQPVIKDYGQLDSFVIQLCIEGSFKLEYQNESMIVNKGECVLIPALITEVKISAQPTAKFLEVYMV